MRLIHIVLTKDHSHSLTRQEVCANPFPGKGIIELAAGKIVAMTTYPAEISSVPTRGIMGISVDIYDSSQEETSPTDTSGSNEANND